MSVSTLRSELLISRDDPKVTLINLFRMAPEYQKEVADGWVGVGPAFADRPGFLAHSLHLSDDGTAIINYGQWESAPALMDAARQNQSVVATLATLSTIEPHVYRLAAVVGSNGSRSLSVVGTEEATTTMRIFTVDPDRQMELATSRTAALQAMADLPGFVGAALHVSLDGVRVAEYAQWDTPAQATSAQNSLPSASDYGPVDSFRVRVKLVEAI
jgi:heme-degrading monooxygenase HmoA